MSVEKGYEVIPSLERMGEGEEGGNQQRNGTIFSAYITWLFIVVQACSGQLVAYPARGRLNGKYEGCPLRSPIFPEKGFCVERRGYKLDGGIIAFMTSYAGKFNLHFASQGTGEREENVDNFKREI